jgi:hypothetical protein
MDKTLNDYLNKADEIYEFTDKYFINLNNQEISDYIIKLQADIKTIQNVAYHLATISNILVRALNRRKNTKINKITTALESANIVDCYPSQLELCSLRSLNPQETKEIVEGINISVKTVELVEEIPISQIYYVKKLKQYAINLGGIIIKGNLGNIVEYQGENSVKCQYGPDCKSLEKNKKCSYYHDPEDYLKHQIEIPDYPKNFTAGSWIYTKNKNIKSYYNRHIGSKDNLIYDLQTIKKSQYYDEICNRESQLMHDLLIYAIINSKGLLQKHTAWKNMPNSLIS